MVVAESLMSIASSRCYVEQEAAEKYYVLIYIYVCTTAKWIDF